MSSWLINDNDDDNDDDDDDDDDDRAGVRPRFGLMLQQRRRVD